MTRRHLLLAALVGGLFAPPAGAADHAYDGQKTVTGETFAGESCTIRVGGRSSVAGTYARPTGTVDVTLDGSSTLTLTGEAHKVVIRMANGQSTVDLRGLKVGAGGVEVKDMNGKSRLYVAGCAGPLDITAVDGGCEIRHKDGAKVVGRDNLKGGSKLVAEK